MNIFQLPYHQILKHWYDLRLEASNLDLQSQCILIDKFWQNCPIQNHYLHPDFINDWPNPWELVLDNHYCIYARALGMVYTLLMLGINDIDFVVAKNENSEDVVLVIVKNKYILNYWPNTVETNKLSDFTLLRFISINSLRNKIR